MFNWVMRVITIDGNVALMAKISTKVLTKFQVKRLAVIKILTLEHF